MDSEHETFLRPEYLSKNTNIVIATYASLSKTIEHINRFNLFMFDEAHHIATEKNIAFIQ